MENKAYRFDQWLERIKGLQPYTIACYVSYVHRILAHTDGTTQGVDDFLWQLHKLGRKGRSLNDYLKAMRAYDEYRGTTLYKDIKFYPEEAPDKGIFSEEEITEFLNLPHKRGEKESRHQMFNMYYKVLAYSGMRPGEVGSLTVDQVDFGTGVFKLYKTKNGDKRNPPISPAIRDELRQYIASRDHYLFTRKDGKPLDNRTWSKETRARLRMMGIKRPGLTTHSFRHSFITRNITDMPLFTLQKIVGHKSADTTQNYIHLTTKDTIEAIKKDRLGQESMDPHDILKNQLETIRQLPAFNDPRFFVKLSESENSIEFIVAIK